MSVLENKTNISWWKNYGDYLFMTRRYEDPVIVSAHERYLVDAEGKEYLDLASGQAGCASLGYGHSAYLQALSNQLDKIIHLPKNFMSSITLEACKAIADVMPAGLSKVLTLSTGSEANETAFRVAKTYTEHFEIVGLQRGYSGVTLQARSASGTGPDKATFPLVSGSNKLLAPYCYRCPLNLEYPSCDILCLDVSAKLLYSNTSGKVAAFIVEPIMSSGGIIVPPTTYLKRLVNLANDYGALVIADEAQTGFARTGKWFCIEHHNITPDIMVISKSMGNGLPISGIVTNKKIADKCYKDGLTQTSSHQLDPLPAVAVLAVIKAIKEENLVKEAEKKGKYLKDRLNELAELFPVIGDIRGIGMMIGVELVKDMKTKEPAREISQMVGYGCLKRGVLLNSMGGIFRIIPPLTITKEEINFAVEAIEASLNDALSGKVALTDCIPKNPSSNVKN